MQPTQQGKKDIHDAATAGATASDATPAASSSSSASSAAPPPMTRTAPVTAKKSNSSFFSSLRTYAIFPFFLLAFLIVALSFYTSITHHYPSPLSLLTLSPSTTPSIYQAEQTCEMSYFFLSHRPVPLRTLSPLSQALLEGKVLFNSSAKVAKQLAGSSAAGGKKAGGKRRSTAEFDEDEELAELELIEEADASSTSPASLPSASDASSAAVFRDDFESFSQIFRRSLPRDRSGSNTRYKLYEYFEHDDSGSTEKYERVYMGTTAAADVGEDAKKNKKKHVNDFARVPILFIHGNGGSYHQVRSLASRLTSLYIADRDRTPGRHPSDRIPDLNDYYAVDFFEESAAFSGSLLWQQAWFINEALHTILARYENGGRDTKVILVGHSMGGILARSLPLLGNFPRMESGESRIALVASLGSPQRAPVLRTDEMMQRMYWAANTNFGREGNEKKGSKKLSNSEDSAASTDAPQPNLVRSPFLHLSPLLNLSNSLHHEQVFLLSIAGGERDFQIEPSLTDLSGIYNEEGESSPRTLSVLSHSIQYAPISESGAPASPSTAVGRRRLESIDHQCLCWCRALMETLAFTIRDFTRNILAKQLQQAPRSFGEMVDRQRKLWIPKAVEMLKPMVKTTPTLLPSPRSPSAGATQQQQWALYAEQFARSPSASIRIPSSALFSSSSTWSSSLFFTWTGLMDSIQLCPPPRESPHACLSVLSAAAILSPQLNPEHTSLIVLDGSVDEMAQKRVGLLSSYTMLLSPASIPLGWKSAVASGSFEGEWTLQFAYAKASFDVISKLRPLRDGNARQVLYGFSFDGEAIPTFAVDDGTAAPSQLLASSASTSPIFRLTRFQSRGMEAHMELSVKLGPMQGDNEHAPPALIAMFDSVQHSSTVNASTSSASSFHAEQLFAFYPSSSSSASTHSRTVHSYRTGFDRSIVGLFIRVPTLIRTAASLNDDDAAPVTDESYISSVQSIQWTDFSAVSFLRTLFLHFSLLPQLVLGAALILFGVQHEYMRRYQEFPRFAQLFALGGGAAATSVTSAVQAFMRSSLLWGMAGTYLAFVCFFQGNLVGDSLIVAPAASHSGAPGAGSAQEEQLIHILSNPAALLWSGWSVSPRTVSWSQAHIGFILFLASLFLLLVLENVVYGLLWGGSRVMNAVSWIVSRPLALFGLSSSSDTPQARYVTHFFRRFFAFFCISNYILAALFTFSLSLLSLRVFARVSWGDTLYFVLQQATAWLSTFAMAFGLIQHHFFFGSHVWEPLVERIVLPWVLQGGMVVGLAVVGTILLQMYTFPRSDDKSSSSSPSTSEHEKKSALSLSAYKSSGVTLLILIVLLFSLPNFLSSLRLDADQIEGAWARIQGSGGSSVASIHATHGHGMKKLAMDFTFQPPGARKMYQPVSSVKEMQQFLATQQQQQGAVAGGSAADRSPYVLLYPFILPSDSSLLDPLVLVSLIWVTLLAWCMIHVPFAPPVLQSACVSTYGFSLLFVHGASTGLGGTGLPLFSLWWIGLMLSLCMVPHSMAAGLYCIQIMWDYIEGKEGDYERRLRQEQMMAMTTGVDQPLPATASTSATGHRTISTQQPRAAESSAKETRKRK